MPTLHAAHTADNHTQNTHTNGAGEQMRNLSERAKVEGIELSRDTQTGEYICGYVGNGSKTAELRTKNPVHLGFCYRPERRFTLLWDLAFGYVSGFPVSAILWFALTRSLPTERMQQRIQAWERRTGRYDFGLREIRYGAPVNIAALRRTA